ncbi:MAG: hypothetical protein AB9919_12290 [Geobacteraceae bacterium]
MGHTMKWETRNAIENKLIEKGTFEDNVIKRYHQYDYDPVDFCDAVEVLDTSVYSADTIEADAEDFQDFLEKVAAGETALVLDVDEDDPRWVSIVFGDGLKVENIHRLTINSIDTD